MNAKGGWAAIDKRLVPWAVGLDPQQLRVARLTAAFALALFFWGPIFAVFYGLLGAYRLSVFVLIAVGLGGLALGALRAKQRRPAAHLLVMGLLGVLAAIGGDTRGVFSPTLMWLPVVPIVALLLLGLRAALVWGAVTIGAVVAFAAAALTGSPGEGVFTGAALTAYHAVSLLSTIALQVSLAMLFESAKVRMAQELEAQRDLAARAHDDARRVLDNVGQALFVVDAKGQVGPSPSATALEWFGANEGRAAWDWLTADGATRGALREHLGAFRPDALQFERDGRWLALRLVPIAGTPTALAICTDLTEAKLAERAEASRRAVSDQLVRAEERSRMKSDFLASTSHELRTPLNTIINLPQGILDVLLAPRRARCTGCADVFELEDGEAAPAACPSCGSALVVQAAEGLTPKVTVKLLQSVVTSGKHLLTVVNDILDYSRLEAGGQRLSRERVPVNDVLEHLEGVIAPVADRAGVGLRIPRASPGMMLSIDRVKLAQVLINLVANAIKFSNGKGEVRVSTTVSEETGSRWVQIAVSDEGIGIALESTKLIFEGFRQVEHGPSRRYGGTGLGLAISRRLVELHGGRLELESQLGVGSTFRVCLPVAPAELDGAAP